MVTLRSTNLTNSNVLPRLHIRSLETLPNPEDSGQMTLMMLQYRIDRSARNGGVELVLVQLAWRAVLFNREGGIA